MFEAIGLGWLKMHLYAGTEHFEWRESHLSPNWMCTGGRRGGTEQIPLIIIGSTNSFQHHTQKPLPCCSRSLSLSHSQQSPKIDFAKRKTRKTFRNSLLNTEEAKMKRAESGFLWVSRKANKVRHWQAGVQWGRHLSRLAGKLHPLKRRMCRFYERRRS